VVPLAAAAAPAVQAGAEEIVLQPIKEISGTVKLPGSKSLSNRILLLAALSEVSGDGPPSLPPSLLGQLEFGCGRVEMRFYRGFAAALFQCFSCSIIPLILGVVHLTIRCTTYLAP
jgi:hypothetical protein